MMPLTKSCEEFFNSDRIVEESDLIGQLNTWNLSFEYSVVITKISNKYQSNISTGKNVSNRTKKKKLYKDERIHGLMLTTKPANVRPHSTVSLSKLLASLTCIRHDAH